MRIFLDANILFSAGKSDGAMRTPLLKLSRKGHALVADGYVLGEARRNIETKFPHAVEDFEVLLRFVHASATVTRHLRPDIAATLPEKDWPVLAGAIHQKCAVLLTGDKTHFGMFYGQTIEGVEIHSPARLALKLAM